jgi:hypothetical protein
MAADGQVGFDPMTRSLLVKPANSEGYARSLWSTAHREMVEAEETGRYYGAPTVWAHVAGRREIARGEAVRDGWLRFKLSAADYRQLAGMPGLSAIATVDRATGRIMGVKFLGRQSG